MVRSTSPPIPDHSSPNVYNHTSTFLSDDPLFDICWRRQSCNSCLKGDEPCSWCPVTSTCVPNAAWLPILAPFGSSRICPLGSKERWELRAVPSGCHVSTITFVTAGGAVLGTLGVVGLGVLMMRACGYWGGGKGGRGWFRQRSGHGHGHGHQEGLDAESEPLLR